MANIHTNSTFQRVRQLIYTLNEKHSHLLELINVPLVESNKNVTKLKTMYNEINVRYRNYSKMANELQIHLYKQGYIHEGDDVRLKSNSTYRQYQTFKSTISKMIKVTNDESNADLIKSSSPC